MTTIVRTYSYVLCRNTALALATHNISMTWTRTSATSTTIRVSGHQNSTSIFFLILCSSINIREKRQLVWTSTLVVGWHSVSKSSFDWSTLTHTYAHVRQPPPSRKNPSNLEDTELLSELTLHTYVHVEMGKQKLDFTVEIKDSPQSSRTALRLVKLGRLSDAAVGQVVFHPETSIVKCICVTVWLLLCVYCLLGRGDACLATRSHPTHWT